MNTEHPDPALTRFKWLVVAATIVGLAALAALTDIFVAGGPS